MNDEENQDLTPEQMLFICSLAIRKIRTDIAFLKSKVNREDSLRYVDKSASQLIDCGILQGLIQAENAFHDVYYSGIWKTSIDLDSRLDQGGDVDE